MKTRDEHKAQSIMSKTNRERERERERKRKKFKWTTSLLEATQLHKY